MKKIISILRRPFGVQYRLTVYYKGDSRPRNCYAAEGRIIRNMARASVHDVEYWTLYKTGPLGLPEREIDSWREEGKR